MLFIDGPSGAEHRQWLIQCCAGDPRCRWTGRAQPRRGSSGDEPGVCVGWPFRLAAVLGLDDWAATPTVLDRVAAALEREAAQDATTDLLVCRGRYADPASGGWPGTVFQTAGLPTALPTAAPCCWVHPPHQATLFGPEPAGAWRVMPRLSSLD